MHTRSKHGSAGKPREYNLGYARFGLARNFQLADYVTILNCFCGVSSILSSLELAVQLNDTDRVSVSGLNDVQINIARWAFGLPFLGMIFDIFDGRVARLTKEGPTMMGQELDSLSDLISFGVAPAVLAWVVGLRTAYDRACLTLFVCAGLARLARYIYINSFVDIMLRRIFITMKTEK